MSSPYLPYEERDSMMPGRVWRNEINSNSMVSLPVAAHLSLVVCRTETGFVLSVSQQATQRDPKIYAGNSLEDLVKTVIGEIVAGKLEA